MSLRAPLVLVLASIIPSMGAAFRTTNFVVEAPTAQIAEQVGQWAEYYRKEKAIQWIGQEMPTWPEPCPLRVTVTASGAGGATSFNFMGNSIWQTMHIEGPLDRLIASVLPHEVTHTVFAYYFRRPVPRWADEGGAVLSEDDLERSRHDSMVRQILNANRAIPLSRLFALRDYPPDVGALYAEGYSVSNFLVVSSNRKTFLDFVGYGMQYGWDNAAKAYYRYQNVHQLEQAWIDYLRNSKRQQAPVEFARNDTRPAADTASRVIVRLTAPPVQPFQDNPAPVFRGQAPEVESSGGWSDAPRQAANRPGYLPEYNLSPKTDPRTSPGTPPAQQDPWRPAAHLGLPQFDQAPPAPGRNYPQSASPVGYPYR
jgi:hypothetical protein